ncbi:cell surface lipoprotein [Methanosarcina sp. 1.H.T.1A.1]|uniref:cell surface lipoprotein n=1 Tax=Methanosarcina sp. 1.H.T.1A.1 TaxID=1483602 RepID=UPI000621AAAE|nr:cell surface lipoprotein [Methanosarcina sp. 1.H.T.1A.1]KKH98150.1 cell surface lipoprotein [Methanosarcina sp. 1.H.T.1A.1]
MIKKLILLLIVLSVLVFVYLNWGGNQGQEEDGLEDSGGSGGSGGTPILEEVQTPEEAITSEEMETPVETETLEEAGTPQETETAGEGETPLETLTPGMGDEIQDEQTENVTDDEEVEIVQPAGTEPETYLVRLKNYLFIPSELEVNTGDIVVWRNFEESIVFTLSSKEGLFEDQRLGYGNTLKYTFNETGSYNFNAREYPNMQMTITVK